MKDQFISRAASHRGAVRTRNEDSFVDRSDIGLWAVADGAGGYGAGDVASAAVAGALADLPAGLSAAEVLAQVRLRIGAVHGELQRRAGGDHKLLASTAVVLLARGTHSPASGPAIHAHIFSGTVACRASRAIIASCRRWWKRAS